MTARGLRTPDVGRIYDALLGGKDNYAEDRRAARRLIAAIPGIVAGARANREFPGRAVRFLAREAGIWQFLDIGAGLTLMPAACPGQAGAGARDAVPAWLIARSRDAGPGPRGAGSPDPGRPRHA